MGRDQCCAEDKKALWKSVANCTLIIKYTNL